MIEAGETESKRQKKGGGASGKEVRKGEEII